MNALFATQIVDETPVVDNTTAIIINDNGTFLVATEEYKNNHQEFEWWELTEQAIKDCLATEDSDYLKIKQLLTND